MIQRIQTLHLMLVTMLAALTLALPVATFDNSTTQLTLSAWELTLTTAGTTTAIHCWGLFAISALIPIVAFTTIWLYRKRMLQIRLCILNILFMLGYYAVFAVCVWRTTATYDVTMHLQLATIFPLINIILTWLALRGVAKDEAKVRAADRLR